MTRRDTRTMDLLAWEPPQVAAGYGADVAGRGPMENKIARLISQALRDAQDEHGLTRETVAGLMTLELHRSITKDMLDKWSSEASTTHRIPLDAFCAMVKVLEAESLLGFTRVGTPAVLIDTRSGDIGQNRRAPWAFNSTGACSVTPPNYTSVYSCTFEIHPGRFKEAT